MNSNYQLGILSENGVRKIDFKNDSMDYVEVIFLLDGKQIRDGRGYCYPPGYHKHIRAYPLPRRHGRIQAYVYSGDGQASIDDDVPPFIKYKINERKARGENFDIGDLVSRRPKKVLFQRYHRPATLVEIPY